MPEAKFTVEGMHCASCVMNVEKSLSKIKGVKHVSVDLATKSARISYEGNIPFEEFATVVQNIGYQLLQQEEKNAEEAFARKEKIRLVLSWVFTLPIAILMLLSMVFHISILPEMTLMYINVFVSGIVIFVIGSPVIRATLLSFKNLFFTMDSLIGIGTIASFSTGILHLLGSSIEDFSVVGAMIMSINHIGNYLKELSTGRASEAIRKLLELGAKHAHLITEDGTLDVPVESLHVGDKVLVKPGEKIPSDGIILDGTTTIDESLATGESLPVDKQKGSPVIGATINLSGAIVVRIEKVGKDTFLSQVIKLVEEAQASKVPIQELADKVTSFFVPVILVLSIISFVMWYFFPQYGQSIRSFFAPLLPWITPEGDRLSLALFAAIATLVIACPCALGLATPTALMVGMGKAASHGILIRKGEAIQRMKDINTLVLDKTGTITEGKPVVSDVIAGNEDRLFTTAYALESLSEHPLAKAIVAFLSPLQTTQPLKVTNFTSFPGKGVHGIINDIHTFAGSIAFLEEQGITIPENIQDNLHALLAEGKTLVSIATEKEWIGAFALADAIKKDSQKAIQFLHSLGLTIIMLTGDNKKSAAAIAGKVGIDHYEAELLPEDKIAAIRKLQSNGKVVAMVGDGINDAPALKQADVGIAIGSGTDIAIESADITLVGGSLLGVYEAIVVSRKTFEKIRQNLFWAFFYNGIAIPLAMFGILHPIIAELAMAMSSITVVTNSLSLRQRNS